MNILISWIEGIEWLFDFIIYFNCIVIFWTIYCVFFLSSSQHVANIWQCLLRYCHLILALCLTVLSMFLLGCLISILNLIISNPKSLVPSSMPQVLFSSSISVKGYFFLPVFRQKISVSPLTFSVFPIPHFISQCTPSAHLSKLHHLSPPPLLQLTHQEQITVFPHLHSCLSPQCSFHFHLWTTMVSDSLWPQSMEFSRPEYWRG